MTTYDEMTPEEQRHEQHHAGARVVVSVRLGGGLMLLAAFLMLLAAFLMGVCAHKVAAAPPLADHRACTPVGIQFPRRVLLFTASGPSALSPSAYAQAQLAMARINSHDMRRDWVVQVPLGQSFDVIVVANSTTYVTMYCGQAGAPAVVYVGTDVPWADWAEHELIHGIFYMGDHIFSYLWPGSKWINPRYCNGSHQNSNYQGIMSYCQPSSTYWNGYEWVTLLHYWTWEDDIWMDGLYP